MPSICRKAVRNLMLSVQEEISGQKLVIKAVVPTAVCSFICLSLGNYASILPPTQVAWATAKVLNALTGLFIIKGAFNIIAALDEKEATLQGRKIEKVEIPKKDFIAMQQEILRLKEDALRLQKENSAFKEKDAILDKVLLPNQKKEIQSYQESMLLGKNNPTPGVQMTQAVGQDHLNVIDRQHSEHFKSV